jgi:hypothetical protein
MGFRKNAAVRFLLPFAVLAFFLLPGCLGGAAPKPATDPGGASSCDGCGGAPPPSGVNFSAERPQLPIGRSWTYRLSLVYDTAKEVTVVVARQDADGYLFAGASQQDVVGDAMWGRFWHGPHTLDLADKEEGGHPFDFPLHDGKSWAYSRTMNVTAHAAQVSTPGHSERGFAIEGQASDASGNTRHIRYEYAPSVGYVTSFTFDVNGNRGMELALTKTGMATGYTWYTAGPAAGACNDPLPPVPPPSVPPPPSAPATLSVPAGFDAVIVSAGSAGGGRVVIAPPAASASQPWTFENAGEERWDSAILPGTEGTWALGTLLPPGNVGFACGRIEAVAWIQSSPGA